MDCEITQDRSLGSQAQSPILFFTFSHIQYFTKIFHFFCNIFIIWIPSKLRNLSHCSCLHLPLSLWLFQTNLRPFCFLLVYPGVCCKIISFLLKAYTKLLLYWNPIYWLPIAHLNKFDLPVPELVCLHLHLWIHFCLLCSLHLRILAKWSILQHLYQHRQDVIDSIFHVLCFKFNRLFYLSVKMWWSEVS